MRILHVSDVYLPRRGGIELHVHDLANAQRQAGDHVDVLTLTRARGTSSAIAPGQLIRPPDSASWLRKLRFIVNERGHGRDHGYDVVHTHCSTFSPLVFATLADASIPTAVTVHSLWRRYTALYRAADVALGWSRRPVAWSAVSQVAAQAVRAAASSAVHVDVVPNGIDVSAWRHPSRGSESGRFRVVSVMRLAPRKRPMALMRMLRTAQAALPSGVHLDAVIIGDGPELGTIRRYLRRHQMHRHVTLAGHLCRSEIARWLAASDVFIAPSTLESFGIAALEACAAGVPVLGREGTGLSEFVVDGAGGLLVRNDAAMVDALVGLATGRQTIRPAESSAVNAMDWDAVLTRTRNLYDRAAATGGEDARDARHKRAS
jgi:glycosyltransferase involved in cell wall biosynthesis